MSIRPFPGIQMRASRATLTRPPRDLIGMVAYFFPSSLAARALPRAQDIYARDPGSEIQEMECLSLSHPLNSEELHLQFQ